MSSIIKLTEVTKNYNENEVVSNVTLHVKSGQIYGFLGPNGAGKTTIMKMILNLVKPTSGQIEVFGEVLNENSYKYLKDIGSLIENPVFYENLTAKMNLKLHCEYLGYYDFDKIDNILEMVHLQGVENKPISKFSLGMKQRLGIARAMISNPKLLILDEPINGLDPTGIKQMRDLFLKLKKDFGTTIFISSHIISEIEYIADVIGIINNGRFLKEVTMENIRHEAVQYTELQVDSIKIASTVLDQDLKISRFKIISEDRIRIYDDSITQNEVSKALILGGANIYSMVTKSGTLEDYFMNIIEGGKWNDKIN